MGFVVASQKALHRICTSVKQISRNRLAEDVI